MDKKFRQRLTFKDRADVNRYLDNLRTRVRNGEITGEQASIAKWNAIISFGSMFVEWWRHCGLCELYRLKNEFRSCVGCPLYKCTANPLYDTMECGKNHAAKLVAAKKFRAWMKRKFREADNG